MRLYDVFFQDADPVDESQTADMRTFFAGADRDKTVQNPGKTNSAEIKSLLAKLIQFGEQSLTQAELIKVREYKNSISLYRRRFEEGVAEGNRPFRGVGGAFNRGDNERHDLDPTDWYIVKDGEMFVASIYPKHVQQAISQGFSRTQDEAQAQADSQGVAEGEAQQLSVQQLAAISDEALDNEYHYGRSTPGNSFGWQANLKSAAYAKQIIDQGETDIEAISDAIHKGWNVTAQAFVQNPDQFDDTPKLQAAGKLEAKLQQRAELMKKNYAQLPEDEKEKDRVVARALLQAITGGGEQGVAEELDQAFLDRMNPMNKKYHTNNPHMTGPNDTVSVNQSGARATRVMPMTAPALVTKKPSTTVARATPSFNKWMSKYKENVEEMQQMIAEGEQMVAEMKQRLDPKCWTGKHKEGTKIKGGVRVNNCVPNESVAEESSPMIKPPANRFDNKQQAFDYAKEHGGKVFKSTYIDPNTGIKNITFVVKKEPGVVEASNTMQRYGQLILKRARAAREYNLDAAQREMDRRAAEGEDMTGATIDKDTYEIVKPKLNSISTRDLMQQLKKPKNKNVAEATGDERFDSMMGQITGGTGARQGVDNLNKSLTARTGSDPETALAKFGQEFIKWLEDLCREFAKQGADRFNKLKKLSEFEDGGETMAHWLIDVAKQTKTSGITLADIQEFSSEFNTHGMWPWQQFPIAWSQGEWQDYKDQWTGPDGYIANLGQGVAEGSLNELSKKTLRSYSKDRSATIRADRRDAEAAADMADDYEVRGDGKKADEWNDESKWLKQRSEKGAGNVAKATIKIAKKSLGVAESHDSEDLANEVYAEFERTYPNLARRADERTIHAAIMDVLNYGGDNNPGALAQDVARAVKQDMQQGVAEAGTSAAVRLGRAIQRTQGRTAASQARSVIPSSIPKKEEPKKDEKKVDEGIQAGDGFIIECGDSAIETVVLGSYNDGILIEFDHTATFMLTDAGITLTEAEYQGRTVPLGKRMAGDVKKSKVYVKKPNGNVVKVNFGDKNMTIKKHLPKHRKSYRARHHCENPGPKWKANYWSCRAW